MTTRLKIPATPHDHASLLETMRAAKEGDVDWKNGRGWSLVYYAGDEHTDFLKQAYTLFFSENGLSPTAFPSLRRFEAEVVSMILDLLGAEGDEAGTMTSGGTESILLAMRAYRDWARARRPEITAPEILVPVSAHPAFLKAGQYFDIKVIPIGLDDQYRADIDDIRGKAGKNTICIVASAPSFPQGVVDPVAAIGEFARQRGIGLHVDACLGGFLLPFARKLGYEVPDFDFTVPGVTSISADLHKNGFAAKGASAILYRSRELRRFQFFVSTDWPGGLYGSPTMAGTRPGGGIAAAWAAIMSLGVEGYMRLTRDTMETASRLMGGIGLIPGLYVIGRPDMSVFTFTADDLNIFAIGDRMDARGWRLDRQNNPQCLHMIATPNHKRIVDSFLADLQQVVADERNNPTPSNGRGAMLYGVTANIEAGADPREVVLRGMENMYDM